MIVPLYLELELADGNLRFLGRARRIGNRSFPRKLPLKGLKSRRAMVNHSDDVLASPN
jgi:hypothetical protein